MTSGVEASPARMFVGREPELSRVLAALAASRTGAGGVVLLEGDPGIGKTRLAEEVADRARTEKSTVLWGRCWESGGAGPYWPWRQVIRSMPARDSRESPHALGLIDLSGAEAGVDADAAERSRAGVFEAVGTSIVVAASENPLLIVLDDLHVADVPSLLLLRYLSAITRDASVLILGTYRGFEASLDPEVSRILRRCAVLGFEVALSGLSRAEVARYVGSSAGAAPDDATLDALFELTAGNPLFVRELMSLAGPDTSTATIPETIRGVVGERIDLLDERVSETIAIASVIGREFDAQTLEPVTGVPAHELVGRLQDAVRANLVERVAGHVGRYAFSHILVRDVVYERLAPTDRMQLHAGVADALAATGRDLTSEIAHHLFEALPIGDRDRARIAALAAAEHALAALAFEDAAKHYERALAITDFDPFELLFGLGDAQRRAGRIAAARDAFERAMRAAPDAQSYASAVLGYTAKLLFQTVDVEAVALLENALRRLGDDDPFTRVRLLTSLARAQYFADDPDAAPRYAGEALEIARELGEASDLVEALSAKQFVLWGPENADERLAAAREVAELAEQTGDTERLFEAHMATLVASLETGDRAAADRAQATYERLAHDRGEPRHRYYAVTRRSMLTCLDGTVDEGEEQARRAQALGERIEEPDATLVFNAMVLALRDSGRISVLDGAFDEMWLKHRSVVHGVLRAMIDLELGRPDEARRFVQELATRGLRTLRRDLQWLLTIAMLSELAVQLNERCIAEECYDLMLPYAGYHVLLAGAAGYAGVVDLYLGRVASYLGRPDDADKHLSVALESHEHMRAGGWSARTLLEFGKALETRDAGRARAMYARARETARRLGLRGLEREIPPPPDEPAGRSAVRAELRRDGDRWVVGYDGKTAFVRDAKGMDYLARLVASPAREVHALDLSGGVDSGDSGVVIDRAARDAYRARLRDLEQELVAIESWNDPEREANIRAEIDALAEELVSGIGLGGRLRTSGSASERARVAVRKAISGAIKRIGDELPELGEHLAATVHTGTFCAYSPHPRHPVAWTL